MKTCLGTGREKESPSQEYRQYMNEDETEREKNRILRILKDDQRLIDVATEICSENSKLRTSFVPDMNCFKEIFDKNDKDQICMNYTTNALNYLRSRVDRLRLERNDEYNNVCLCLRVLLDMNCFVEQFDRECSSLAKDTVLEIIEKAGSLYYQCPVSSRLDILELLDDLKLVTRKNIFVRQLLETDSFF
ncbi:hypothetical protein AVEN_137989-1 [Araneus ventricosus]|uniref:Uncharacterized protein n=1 Tax=Araneus ventricosus TaxID=182803 RepID=A0A4Y2KRG8_ARAVE|nr:hypothetical protein AVEN_137989-1 [Araneus ventricosus]